MRTVLDTNALASGTAGLLISDSVPGALIHAWLAGEFILVTSGPILNELARALEKPYFVKQVPRQRVVEVLTMLREQAEIVELTANVQGVASHPEDDAVLNTALSGDADYLVTGDRDLLYLRTFGRVEIVTPREFLEILRAADPSAT